MDTKELREAHIEQMKRFDSDPEVGDAARVLALHQAVAREVRAARLAAKLSRAELAERVRMSPSTLARIERGHNVKLSTLEDIAFACGKRLEFRLVRTDRHHVGGGLPTL